MLYGKSRLADLEKFRRAKFVIVDSPVHSSAIANTNIYNNMMVCHVVRNVAGSGMTTTTTTLEDIYFFYRTPIITIEYFCDTSMNDNRKLLCVSSYYILIEAKRVLAKSNINGRWLGCIMRRYLLLL